MGGSHGTTAVTGVKVSAGVKALNMILQAIKTTWQTSTQHAARQRVVSVSRSLVLLTAHCAQPCIIYLLFIMKFVLMVQYKNTL